MLLAGSHIFYKHENEATVTATYPIKMNIMVKVEEVYDSTATAVIYQSNDPNIRLKVGDFVLY